MSGRLGACRIVYYTSVMCSIITYFWMNVSKGIGIQMSVTVADTLRIAVCCSNVINLFICIANVRRKFVARSAGGAHMQIRNVIIFIERMLYSIKYILLSVISSHETTARKTFLLIPYDLSLHYYHHVRVPVHWLCGSGSSMLLISAAHTTYNLIKIHPWCQRQMVESALNLRKFVHNFACLFIDIEIT